MQKQRVHPINNELIPLIRNNHSEMYLKTVEDPRGDEEYILVNQEAQNDSEQSDHDSEIDEKLIFMETATDVGSTFLKCSLDGNCLKDSSYQSILFYRD